MHSEKILRAAVHPPSSKYKIIRIFFHLWLDIISLKHQCRPFIITTLSLSSSYYLTSDFFLLFSKSSCTFPYFSGSNIDHSCLLLGISEGMLLLMTSRNRQVLFSHLFYQSQYLYFCQHG